MHKLHTNNQLKSINFLIGQNSRPKIIYGLYQNVQNFKTKKNPQISFLKINILKIWIAIINILLHTKC